MLSVATRGIQKRQTNRDDVRKIARFPPGMDRRLQRQQDRTDVPVRLLRPADRDGSARQRRLSHARKLQLGCRKNGGGQPESIAVLARSVPQRLGSLVLTMLFRFFRREMT